MYSKLWVLCEILYAEEGSEGISANILSRAAFLGWDSLLEGFEQVLYIVVWMSMLGFSESHFTAKFSVETPGLSRKVWSPTPS